jgi:hypothetical protein
MTELERRQLENELAVLQQTADSMRAIGHQPKRLERRINEIKAILGGEQEK